MIQIRKLSKHIPLWFIIPALIAFIYSLAHATDLNVQLKDVQVQNKIPTVSVPCREVRSGLMRSYANKAPDQMFVKRYSDILCRCGQGMENKSYQVLEPTSQCLRELGQCYQATTAQVVRALDQCRREGNSWEECKNLNFEEVVSEPEESEFFNQHQGVLQACR
ncbi:MAG: hypothetical protein ACREP8_14020 [Candidatus Binatia bacterium]